MNVIPVNSGYGIELENHLTITMHDSLKRDLILPNHPITAYPPRALLFHALPMAHHAFVLRPS
jgi:hypothetical protein